MTVEKIRYTDTLRQGADKINAAIDQSNEAIEKATTADTNASQALALAQNVQTQLDTIVIEGDSSVEAAQARVDADGNVFSTLKERLDTKETLIQQQLETTVKKGELVRNVKDFGAVGDGIADDTAAIQAAIDSLPDPGGIVFFPAGVYKVTSTIQVGNGTDISLSTKNGVHLIGSGSKILYDGPLGTVPVIRFAGSGERFGLKNLKIDCNNKAIGMSIISVRESVFENFEIRRFHYAGLFLDIRAMSPSDVAWASGNTFKNFLITSESAQEYGMYVEGNYQNNHDWHRNVFINGIIQLPRGSTITPKVAYLGFCDSNTFIEVDFSVYGEGNGVGIVFDGRGNKYYPQNNFFYGCSISSVLVQEEGEDVIGNNYFIAHPTVDNETIPNHPKLRGFTDRGVYFGGDGIELRGSVRKVRLVTNSGSTAWDILANANDSADFGFEIQRNGNTVCSIQPDGSFFIYLPTIGALRKIEVGSPNSGGTGYRSLVVSN